ncbi:helix-turn-helix domain-containing protein [Desulfonatronum parangueonense]
MDQEAKDKHKEKQKAAMALKIKEIRGKLDHTQEQFARLLQVQTSTVAGWEQERNLPGKDSIKAIEDIEEMTHDEDFVRVVQDSIWKKDGFEAVAVLIGMILGLTKITKLRYDVAKNMLRPGSTYLAAAEAYLDRAGNYYR